MKNFINQIILGDCITELKKISTASIDLIFADPPYNLQLQKDLYRPNQTKVSGVNDAWDKFHSFKEYDTFCEKWLRECKRILKDTGAIWLIGSYHNIFRLGKILQDLEYWLLNDILWIKNNPMPNFRGTRFNNAHETLIWAAKNSKTKYTFNYKSMKIHNDDKQMRSDWFLPICQGKERALKLDGKKAHSTQKPLALLKRIILATSKVGDVVLDPFLGSGTTAVACKLLGRNFIGIERENIYIPVAKSRIDSIQPIQPPHLALDIDKKTHRVPFGALIDTNMIQVGEKLYSKDQKYYGTVLASGSIKNTDDKGSIHSLSAHLLDKSSNNGWTFWYVKRQQKLVSIDALRTKYANQFIQ